jgi:hypothetical protein
LVTPRSREKVHHSRRMPQCYPGEQCASGGQKAHAGSSGRPCLPRGRNAVPQWERLHLLHRAVSHHGSAAHCSVGSFSGNSMPREASLKSAHDPNLGRFPPLSSRGPDCRSIVLWAANLGYYSVCRSSNSGEIISGRRLAAE